MASANEPAYPMKPEYGAPFVGLTKREVIAAMCLQGLLTDPKYHILISEVAAKEAVGYADALLAALEEKESDDGN